MMWQNSVAKKIMSSMWIQPLIYVRIGLTDSCFNNARLETR